jgi:putative flippase GtrA
MAMHQHKLTKLLKSLYRYSVVGLLNNAWGYFLYLFVTWLGMDPRLAVSMFYPVAAVSAYFAHAKYSFNYQMGVTSAKFRFVIAQIIGYLVNVTMLSVLVERFGYPHQIVQAAAIFVIAGVLFFLFRFYVFPVVKTKEGETESHKC